MGSPQQQSGAALAFTSVALHANEVSAAEADMEWSRRGDSQHGPGRSRRGFPVRTGCCARARRVRAATRPRLHGAPGTPVRRRPVALRPRALALTLAPARAQAKDDSAAAEGSPLAFGRPLPSSPTAHTQPHSAGAVTDFSRKGANLRLVPTGLLDELVATPGKGVRGPSGAGRHTVAARLVRHR
jgi:hypothetical protein